MRITIAATKYSVVARAEKVTCFPHWFNLRFGGISLNIQAVLGDMAGTDADSSTLVSHPWVNESCKHFSMHVVHGVMGVMIHLNPSHPWGDEIYELSQCIPSMGWWCEPISMHPIHGLTGFANHLNESRPWGNNNYEPISTHPFHGKMRYISHLNKSIR